MYPHRIRLRGPWEYQRPQSSGRLTLPVALVDTPLSASAGAVCFRRRFGYPGRIDPGERVWLVIEAPAGPLTLSLNGEPIGWCAGDAEWDVTDRLRPRNELVIETTLTPGEPWREAALEVRRTAYLRGLRVFAEPGRILAEGELVGFADAALDLYLVAERRTVAYTSLVATQGGTAFQLAGEAGEPVRLVKVEVTCGAVAWYTAEVELRDDREREG